MKLNFSVLKQLLLLRFIILINRYFAHFILLYEIDGSSLTFYVRRRFVYSFSTLLKYHFFSRCQQVSEMLCVDNPSLPNRFELVYIFTSYAYSTRILMRTFTTPGLNAMTLTPLFAVLNWQEREVWDMFGVAFFGHPDLRRILTDYGFLGHPLRKDFPLSGFVEVYFDDTAQLVCYQPLSLAQEFRDFSQGLNPWLEGSAR